MNQEQGIEAPKIDLKMMVLPAMFFLQKQIDLKDPNILNNVRIGLITVGIIGLATYFFIKQIIDSKNNNTKIWIPPKQPPQIPFLSPPAEPIKPEDYTETTYKKHENKLIMEAIQGIVMSCGIAALMSFKFNIHMSCLMQAVMVPVGLYDNVLVQKYIFGSTKPNLYNELLAAPTLTDGNTNNTNNTDDNNDDDNRPRVEELDSEPTTTSKTTKNDKSKSPIDVKKEEVPSSDDDDTVKVEKKDVNDID
mmetsp:Transcript_18515/g.19285  ORF Transcript_18515/g.19285 Transcript_18515/m.19285 type:complete len:249 (-) Transcript_18515:100-846(-)